MVHETICLLEVIYKVKKKLGTCPLVTSLLSARKETRRALASFFPCSSPTASAPLFKPGAEVSPTLEGDTSEQRREEQHQHQDWEPAGSSVPFCCWDLPKASLESSPWHPAAPGSHTLRHKLHQAGVPCKASEAA